MMRSLPEKLDDALLLAVKMVEKQIGATHAEELTGVMLVLQRDTLAAAMESACAAMVGGPVPELDEAVGDPPAHGSMGFIEDGDGNVTFSPA